MKSVEMFERTLLRLRLIQEHTSNSLTIPEMLEEVVWLAFMKKSDELDGVIRQRFIERYNKLGK